MTAATCPTSMKNPRMGVIGGAASQEASATASASPRIGFVAVSVKACGRPSLPIHRLEVRASLDSAVGAAGFSACGVSQFEFGATRRDDNRQHGSFRDGARDGI